MILIIITILMMSILGMAIYFSRRSGRLAAEKKVMHQQNQQLERMLHEAVTYDKRPDAVLKRLRNGQF